MITETERKKKKAGERESDREGESERKGEICHLTCLSFSVPLPPVPVAGEEEFLITSFD